MKNRWYNKFSHTLAVPVSQKKKIKQIFTSEEKQLKAFVEYIYAFHPHMSWSTVAGVLYSMQELRALEELKTKGYLIKKKGSYDAYICLDLLAIWYIIYKIKFSHVSVRLCQHDFASGRSPKAISKSITQNMMFLLCTISYSCTKL